MAAEWEFLIDECIDPDVASALDSDTIRAEAVKDALWMGCG